MRKVLLSASLALPLLLGARPPESGLSLPPARTALAFAPDTQEVSLEFLLDALARSTGAELALAQEDRLELRRKNVKLNHSAEVPAEELYAFVESQLVAQGVALAPVKGGTRPVLAVHTPSSGRMRGSCPPDPLPVSPAELEAVAGHPALLVRTMLRLENIDARQLQTQLRQLLVDPSGFMNVVPVGERALLLQGRASFLAGLTRQVHELDLTAASGQPVAPESLQLEQGAR